MRPVTLLEAPRKVISKIFVTRSEEAFNTYISQSQSAYRKGRSTGDALWAFRWIVAKIQEHQGMEVYIVGVDMSSAFDTIHRQTLLNIASNVLQEDELRILRYLLSKTTLEIRIKKLFHLNRILDHHRGMQLVGHCSHYILNIFSGNFEMNLKICQLILVK